MAEQELSEHPEYTARAEEFQKYQDLYTGDHDTLIQAKYLVPHELEKAQKDGYKLRAIREARTQYTNFFEPVESTWVSIVLSDKLDVPPAVTKLFGDYENNVDGEGHSLLTFLREKVAPQYFRFGRAYILTDAPKDVAPSRADEIRLGIRPRFKMLDVLDVRDWQFRQSADYATQLTGIRSEALYDEPRASLTQKPNRALYSYVRELVGNEYVTLVYKRAQDADKKAAWELVETITLSGWDELPVSTICTDPWLRDVGQQTLRVFNLESALDSCLNGQAFQRIIAAGDLTNDQKMAWNEYAINFAPAGTSIIVVNPADTASLSARIEQTINYLIRNAFNRSHGLTQDSKEAPSAQSTNAMKSEQMALATAAADDIENLINNSIRHFAKFKGIQDFQERVTLGKNFSEENIDQQIALFQAYADAIRKVPTWYKAHLKRVAERENLAEIDEIKTEIDGMQIEQQPQQQDLRSQLLQKLGNGNAAGSNKQNPGGAEAAGSANQQVR